MSAPDEVIAGRYRLVRLVGRGGMGSVWEARDERLGRPVALKLLHRQYGLAPADAELANQRAMREARITARVHHRFAVPVFDVVEHDGRPCLVMQFVPSIPLSQLLKETGPLEPTEAARMGAQVSSALAAAHAVGVVHRDVKPGNILIGDDGTALISDFGISHAFGDATLTATGLVHGTPAFLAPEVARGADTTSASDVFSFGSTLYAAIEGHPPFGTDPNTMALLHRVASGEFTPPTRTGALTGLVTSMLAVDPAARPTMAEVAAKIADVAQAGASPAPSLITTLAITPAAPVTPAAPEPQPSAPTSELTTPKRPVWAAPPAPAAARSAAAVRSPGPADPPARPPAAPPATTRPSVTEPARPPQRRNGVLIAVIVLLAVAVVIATVIAVARNLDGLTGSDDPSRSATAPSESAASDPESEASAPESSTAPPPSASSSAASTSPTPSTTPTPSASASTPTAAELAAVITRYYSVMPDNPDEGWTDVDPGVPAESLRRPGQLRGVLEGHRQGLGQQRGRQAAEPGPGDRGVRLQEW